MYRLQVFFQKRWRWGTVEYTSLEKANDRVQELTKVGIKARVKKNAELFS